MSLRAPRTEQGTEHRRLRPSRGLLSQPGEEFITALTGQGHDRACRQMLAVEPIQERATRWLPDDDPLIGETLQRSPRIPSVVCRKWLWLPPTLALEALIGHHSTCCPASLTE